MTLSPKKRIVMWMILSFVSGIIVGDFFEVDLVHLEDERPCIQIAPSAR